VTTRSSGDISEELQVWPLHVTVGGESGWTLYFSAEINVLLARNGRVQLFRTPDQMRGALLGRSADFQPDRASDLDSATLELLLEAPSATIDLDAAAEWLRRSDRPASLEAADAALRAINLADDIGATVSDGGIRELFLSPALDQTHDALTFGLSIIGEGSPFHKDASAITRAIEDDGAAAAVQLLTLAQARIEFDGEDSSPLLT
jgi:hypothetical protein